MTAQEYYNFFASRPADKWTTGSMGTADDKHCAVGWVRKDLKLYSFEAGLKELFFKYKYITPEQINDGFPDTEIFGDSPRERILTVLSQIILFEQSNKEFDGSDRSEVAPELATVAA